MDLIQEELESTDEENRSEPDIVSETSSTATDTSDSIQTLNQISVFDQKNKCVGNIILHAFASGGHPPINNDNNVVRNDFSSRQPKKCTTIYAPIVLLKQHNVSNNNNNKNNNNMNDYDKIIAVENLQFPHRDRSFLDFICCRSNYCDET